MMAKIIGALIPGHLFFCASVDPEFTKVFVKTVFLYVP
jgi:hypothetical protein